LGRLPGIFNVPETVPR